MEILYGVIWRKELFFGVKGFRVPAFQGFRVPGFQGFRGAIELVISFLYPGILSLKDSL
jgi:hypothetical protein